MQAIPFSIIGDNQRKSDHLSNLPYEVLINIAENLNTSELNRLWKVSKLFQGLVESIVTWKLRRRPQIINIKQVLQAQWIRSNPQATALATHASNLLPKDNDLSFRALRMKAEAAACFLKPNDDVDLIGLAIEAESGTDHKFLKALLLMGADPNGTGRSLLSPLNRTISRGDLSAAKILLDHKANPEGGPDEPALHLASRLGQLEMVQLLLKKQANPNQTYLLPDTNGLCSTPLRAAFGAREVSIASCLLQNGAIPNHSLPGETPLECAVRIGHTKLVQLVLKSAVEKEATGYALNIAIEMGRRELVELLLDGGVNINNPAPDGQTAVHAAVEQSDCSMLRLLHNHGADLNARNEDDTTPLWAALGTDLSAPVVGQLLELQGVLRDTAWARGTNQTLNDASQALLHSAALLNDRGSLRLLLQAGVPIDNLDEDLSTALHAAAENGDATTVALLIQTGANLEARNGEGYTPLLCAIKHENEDNVRVLLDAHANAHVSYNYGLTRELAIHCAARKGNREIVQLLIEHGADPRALTGSGTSPRGIAELRSHTQLYDLLPQSSQPERQSPTRHLKRKRETELD